VEFMTEAYKSRLIQVDWADIRAKIEGLNPVLAELIDDLNLDPKKYLLFKATYPFGTESIKEGKFYLPNSSGQMVPLTDNRITQVIRDQLSYNIGSNPVSIVLKNTLELFIKLNGNTILSPYGLIPPGKIFSTWRILSPAMSHQPAFLWHICAGARSLLMLPKIMSVTNFKKLKRKFHLYSEMPKEPYTQWELFRELANHDEFGEDWHCEVLYFGKRWFDHLDDKKWALFKMYLYKCAWDGSEFWRNQFIWDLVLSTIQRNRNLRPDPYIADTVKYLISMGVGAVPGFAPAIDDTAGPIKRLQQIFTDVYQLENYEPLIMQPKYFLFGKESNPIYYFLQNPTTIEFSPKSRAISNKIGELFDIKYLLDKYLEEILSGNLNLHGTPICQLPEKVKYDYFHTENKNYRGVKSTNEIPIEDKAFKISEGRAFPANSPLINGCVRISNIL
jgi:hypothetical protein